MDTEISCLMNRNTFLLVSILLIAFFARMYRVTGSIADWHSWRQADTAAVTRNFDKLGFDPLRPRYDDLSNVQSGKDNPYGYRMVEFPLYNIVAYGVAKAGVPFGMSLELAHRLVSIAASLGSIVFLYAIVSEYVSRQAGLFTSFFYAIIPYSVYYSRVILPEPLLVFCSLGMVWGFIKANSNQQIANRNLYGVLSVLFGVAALLVKPVSIFYTVPIIYLWIRKKDYSLKSILAFICFFIAILTPLLFWRSWISQFPEGVPEWQWLLNGKGLELSGSLFSVKSFGAILSFMFGYDPDGIRYRPAFFRWILWERIAKLILGYAGMLMLLAGSVTGIKKWRHNMLFIVWAAAMGLYVVVFAQGNVRHDYYQISIIPVICMWMGIGADYIVSLTHANVTRIVAYTSVGLITAGMVVLSWQQVQGYYWINNPGIIEAGKAVDSLVPFDAKVIAPYGGDTAFLYQTNRQGWPVGFTIEDKVEKGADYYVNTNVTDGETKYVMEKYTPVVVNDRYVIVDLR